VSTTADQTLRQTPQLGVRSLNFLRDSPACWIVWISLKTSRGGLWSWVFFPATLLFPLGALQAANRACIEWMAPKWRSAGKLHRI
jgi:hypothetical protein